MELCKQSRNLEAIDRYYSADIVSVESTGDAKMPAEMKGIEAIRQKNRWWLENNEIHEARIDGPYLGENGFAIEFEYDFTNKPSGKRIRMKEMGLYRVEAGKIVREHFFYNPDA